jgi:hypothetical protein
MIEELWVFLIILISSIIAHNLLLKDRSGYFYPIILRLAFIGVVVHEISHYVMNLAVGIKPEGITIRWRDKQTHVRSPHGAVLSKPRSFLQAFVICLAPLYISTWLIFFSLHMMVDSEFIPMIRILAGFFFISLLLGASPSAQDFNNIPNSFRIDPSHSLYQIFLVFISGLILWLILISIHIKFILDVFYYLSIIGIYLLLKFSLIGMNRIVQRINLTNYRKTPKLKYKRFTRRHYKPKKPPKLR